MRRVDDTFRLHTLSCTILVLDAPTQLNIAIQQQILDGVVAVVKLSRSHQYSGRIPLLIFDRSGRPNDVRFNGMFIGPPMTMRLGSKRGRI